MKKILRVSAPLAFLLFFFHFMSYETSRMQKPASISLWEILIGKDFAANGTIYSSGFNGYALLAILAAVLAVVAAFLLNGLALRLAVGISSAGSIFGLSMAVNAFQKDSDFVMGLSQAVKGGVEFHTTTMFAVILAVLVLNLLITLTTANFSRNMLRYKWFFLMLAPTILFFVVFAYIPMAGIAIVFLDYNITDIWQSTWAGLKWFRYLFENINGEFGQVIVNTLVVAVFKMLIGFPAPILLALLFNECKNIYFKKTIQTISYLPYFVSWSIIGGLIISLASTDYSLVNGILKAFNPGSRGFYLLNEDSYIRATLILSNVWKNVGWGTVIYMAALSGVNPELYESARLDGAGKVAGAWYITLPGISHIITLQLILSTPGLLSDNFEQAMNLVYPTTVEKGKTLSMYIYEIGVRGAGQLGMGGNYSYSTAIGLLNSLLSMLLLVIANAVGKRINDEGTIW